MVKYWRAMLWNGNHSAEPQAQGPERAMAAELHDGRKPGEPRKLRQQTVIRKRVVLKCT